MLENHHFLGWDYTVDVSQAFNAINRIQKIGYFRIDGNVRGLHEGQIVQAAQVMSQGAPAGHGNCFQDALNNTAQTYKPDLTSHFGDSAKQPEPVTLRIFVPEEEHAHEPQVLEPAA